VAGIDAGAPPAFLLALQRPELVSRLVLMESLLGRLPGAEDFLSARAPSDRASSRPSGTPSLRPTPAPRPCAARSPITARCRPAPPRSSRPSPRPGSPCPPWPSAPARSAARWNASCAPSPTTWPATSSPTAATSSPSTARRRCWSCSSRSSPPAEQLDAAPVRGAGAPVGGETVRVGALVLTGHLGCSVDPAAWPGRVAWDRTPTSGRSRDGSATGQADRG
jgi:hypothetical protein